MKRYMFSLLLLEVTVLMAQSLSIPNPPIGQQFYDTYNSISIRCRSNNGIVWTIVNNMSSGALRVDFMVQGGAQSVHENVILNSYTPVKTGALGQNNDCGDSYEEFSVTGTATCDCIPSEQVGNIGSISVSYYGEET